MALVVKSARDHLRVPWRNGRGTTLEFARAAAPDGALIWRLSQADVVEDGAFSAFPGLERTILLTDGPGFHLDFGVHGGADLTQPLKPVVFSGAWETRAFGVSGPSKDLNLMIDPARIAARLEIHHAGVRIAPAPEVLLLALAGVWTLEAGEARATLAPLDLAHQSGTDDPPAEIMAEGQGTLVSVRLTPQG